MMRWARSTAAGAALSAALVAATSAAAATQPPAAAPASGGIFRSNGGPIDIASDHGAEQFQNEGRTVWRGDVDVVQGDARLRTPELTLFSAKKAGAPKTNDAQAGVGNIERIEAEGPVYYVTPTQQVKGDHGTYIAADDTITVTGNVTLPSGAGRAARRQAGDRAEDRPLDPHQQQRGQGLARAGRLLPEGQARPPPARRPPLLLRPPRPRPAAGMAACVLPRSAARGG